MDYANYQVMDDSVNAGSQDALPTLNASAYYSSWDKHLSTPDRNTGTVVHTCPVWAQRSTRRAALVAPRVGHLPGGQEPPIA